MRRIALLLLVPLAWAAEKPTAKMLMDLDEQFCRDFAAKGVEGWLEHFADDAIVFTPRGPIKTGMPDLRAHYEKVFANPGNLRWKPVGGFVAKGGDLGYTYGTWQSSGKDKDGKKVSRTGKYFSTWKLQKDGSWKIVADIGQPDQPPEK
jgi:ketosteroid isomerase-like protein